MKMVMKSIMIPLVVATLAISGCSQNPVTVTVTDSTSNSGVSPQSPVEIPQRDEILILLYEAAQIDYKATGKKSYSSDELYAHYESHFTHDYVNNVVLKGSLWEQKGDQWVLREGTEQAEGSYFQDHFNEQTEIKASSDPSRITVVHHVGDGLYAPHKEVITLINTEKGWKVDNVIWEPLN